MKIPQLAIRDTTGHDYPAYFNIWQWIQPQLTPAERGGKKGSPKPEAILKYAHHPIAMLAGLGEKEREEWRAEGSDPRLPVFNLVCKNTRIAKVICDWLANNESPTGIPPAKIEGFRNKNGQISTIRVDSKVVHETDTSETKSDEARWMRVTLDTVGKTTWTCRVRFSVFLVRDPHWQPSPALYVQLAAFSSSFQCDAEFAVPFCSGHGTARTNPRTLP